MGKIHKLEKFFDVLMSFAAHCSQTGTDRTETVG